MLSLIGALGLAGLPQDLPTREAGFDRDPAWEGIRNRIAAKPVEVVQAFGYGRTKHAGEAAGEIGGRVWRTIAPAFYALKIPPRSLQEPAEFSGSFAVTASNGGSGLFFGWFNHARQAFRPAHFLGFRLDGERTHATLHVDYSTGTLRTGGLNTRLRVLPDGARHRWTLSYDPAANDGHGALRFTLDDHAAQVLKLAPGHKNEPTTLDRFGFFNVQLPGDSITVYFDDLVVDGKRMDFSVDPGWEEAGSRAAFRDGERDDAQDFGFSATAHAGGGKGEIGGTVWRLEPDSPNFGYYADRIGPLSLADPLRASGRLSFTRASSDSGVFFGWFNSSMGQAAPVKAEDVKPTDFVGFLLEGPSAVGHYLRLYYSTSDGRRGDSFDRSPIVLPDGRPRTWAIAYDPAGNGALKGTLDGTPFSLDLGPGHQAKGAAFDRFGIFTMRRGGHYLTFYLDDLVYTAGRR